jgi:hypothetical protein
MDTIAPTWLWLFFIATVLAALFVDFVVLKKQGAHAVGVKGALNWSIVWVALSIAFNGLFWWAVMQDHGTAVANEKSMEFLTGYLIEKSLAVDNIFVFLLIFTYFAVPAFQKRVLIRHHRRHRLTPGALRGAGDGKHQSVASACLRRGGGNRCCSSVISPASSLKSAACQFCRRCSVWDDLGRTITPGCASIQASASCAGATPRRVAMSRSAGCSSSAPWSIGE